MMREGGGIREVGRGMTGLNLKRLSLIPSGEREGDVLQCHPSLPCSGYTRVTQPIARRTEGRGGENNKVFTMIRHET